MRSELLSRSSCYDCGEGVDRFCRVVCAPCRDVRMKDESKRICVVCDEPLHQRFILFHDRPRCDDMIDDIPDAF